ncbi:MAG: flippase-like domain-containing protein [Bdellovibrionales bacterium]|nr:flippase-like domain-containing protein [Bdellovibrionales bacterium]
MKQSSLLALIGSALVSATFVLFVASEIPLRRAWEMISSIHLPSVLTFVALSLLASALRAIRYKVLLQAADSSVSSFGLFLVILVRNVTADLLPARLGSLVYIFLAKLRLGVSVENGVASFALAILFDALSLAPLIILAVGAVHEDLPLSVPNLILAATILGAISLAAILLLPRVVSILKVDLRLYRLLPSARSLQIQHFFSRVEREITATREHGVYSSVLLLSIFLRISKYASLYFFLHAIVFPLRLSFHDLPWSSVFLSFVAAEASASLPIAGIFGIGMYESSLAFALSLTGLEGQVSLLASVLHRWITQLWGVLLGGGALCLLSVKSWENEQEAPKVSPRIALLASAAAFSLIVGLGISAAQTASPEVSSQKTASIGEQVPFEIVYDSNSSGTFGIYLYSRSGQTSLLYDSEFEEMFPDPSPDGNSIVFARARSTARYSPSDIWIMQRDGTHPRLLIENGTFPTFSGDGKRVYFERQREKVMAFSIESGKAEILFPVDGEEFKRAQVVKPRVADDGRSLLFTSDSPSPWYAWRAEPRSGIASSLKRGCEPVALDNDLLFVELGDASGNSRLRLTSVKDPAGGALLTDSAQNSYFPSFSQDGRYLLYSRSKEHSHESAPYDLYLYERATQSERRLLESTSTDRWPKELPSSPSTPEHTEK